eukprot:90497-Prorocentrum_minimum.AAC.1
MVYLEPLLRLRPLGEQRLHGSVHASDLPTPRSRAHHRVRGQASARLRGRNRDRTHSVRYPKYSKWMVRAVMWMLRGVLWMLRAVMWMLRAVMRIG